MKQWRAACVIKDWVVGTIAHTACHCFTPNAFSSHLLSLVLFYPVMLSHFLHSLGNYTRRAIFPDMCKINQSSVDFHCEPYDHFDLIGLVDSYRPICFYGGGAKVTQRNGDNTVLDLNEKKTDFKIESDIESNWLASENTASLGILHRSNPIFTILKWNLRFRSPLRNVVYCSFFGLTCYWPPILHRRCSILGYWREMSAVTGRTDYG